MVNVPFEINLDFLLLEKEKYKESTYYSLYAIIVHVGSGGQYGHYFNIIKHGEKWFKYNDENVQVFQFT